MVLQKDPLQPQYLKELCKRRGKEDGPGSLSAVWVGEAVMGTRAARQDSSEEDIWVFLFVWSR